MPHVACRRRPACRRPSRPSTQSTGQPLQLGTCRQRGLQPRRLLQATYTCSSLQRQLSGWRLHRAVLQLGVWRESIGLLPLRRYAFGPNKNDSAD